MFFKSFVFLNEINSLLMELLIKTRFYKRYYFITQGNVILLFLILYVFSDSFLMILCAENIRINQYNNISNRIKWAKFFRVFKNYIGGLRA